MYSEGKNISYLLIIHLMHRMAFGTQLKTKEIHWLLLQDVPDYHYDGYSDHSHFQG